MDLKLTYLLGWLVGLLASLFPVMVERTVQVPLTSYSLFRFLLGMIFSLCSIAAVLVSIFTIINIIAGGGVMMMMMMNESVFVVIITRKRRKEQKTG